VGSWCFGWGRGINKEQAMTTRFDRRFYTEQLSKVLLNPSMSEISRAYYLTFTEATEENLNHILKYINNGSYFSYWKLSGILKRLTRYEDEFGETIGVNIYQIYLLIDNKGQFYFAVIYMQFIGDYKTELTAIKKVAPFLYQIIFRNRRLVYPID
jgi:hypothetical protein